MTIKMDKPELHKSSCMNLKIHVDFKNKVQRNKYIKILFT